MERLGQILQKRVGLAPEILAQALAAQSENNDHQRIGQLLMQMGAISEKELLTALGEQFNIEAHPGALIEHVDSQLFDVLPTSFLKRHNVLPIAMTEDRVTVAISDPLELSVVDQIAVKLNRSVEPVLCAASEIQRAINILQEETAGTPESIMDDLSPEQLDRFTFDGDEPENLLDSMDDAPIIKLVNYIFSQAVRDRASDIHIEPYEREVKIRYRIDGVLYDRITPPKNFQSAIVSRVKVMANLDIAEKRLPQDGRIKLRIGEKNIDVRVSVLPTSHGERVAMRLLDRSSIMLGLDEIGLDAEALRYVRKTITHPFGIILVTGPTGSGKTTTLYAALSEINSEDKNIITVEDPIEYQLQGIGQIHVNAKIGLTFARGLRSILRQDPDVIMVGEIRDVETAEIAIQASLTGHLVFSTLHTNDSPSAFTRLVDMGIEPFLVSSSVISVMAQRLVRVLCSACRRETPFDAQRFAGFDISMKEVPSPVRLYQGRGCESCFNTGYTGRTGIYEILDVTPAIQKLVMSHSDANEIREAALREGMSTLKMSGIRLALQGVTSLEEVLRVVSD